MIFLHMVSLYYNEKMRGRKTHLTSNFLYDKNKEKRNIYLLIFILQLL